ncbi:MAG: hypothetical protein NVSMB64_06250 [Candidatus Velthaea sp.]
MLLDATGREIRRVNPFGFAPGAVEWVPVEPDACPNKTDAIAAVEITPKEEDARI